MRRRLPPRRNRGTLSWLRVNEQGERFPLTIADTDPEKGTITIVYLVMGKSTMMLEALSEGDSILDVAGPLGKATHIVKGDSVICVGGGTASPRCTISPRATTRPATT